MPAFPTIQPQAQAAPLNDEGQQAVAQLLQNDAARKRLRDRQRQAALTLGNVAGNVNDIAYGARKRHGNKLRQLEEEGEEEPEEELDDFNKYQDQVQEVTQKLDLGLRGIIDDIDWLANVPDALKAVAVRSGAIAEDTQRTQSTIPMTTQRSRRTVEDEDEEMVDASGGDPASIQLDPENAPTALLQTAFQKHASAWNAKSLTEKYSETNEYRGFYKTVHDAKNQGDDDVPVPHHTTWFAGEEGRRIEPTTGASNDDEDEEIAVGRVVIRTKCPVTLQTFRDPVTSKKCPHSFERNAFFELLKQTTKHLPFTPEQVQELDRIRNRNERAKKEKENSIPAIDCPECGKLLAEDDVERDSVLQRKVQRMEAEKQREQEAEDDSEEDDDLPRGTQRKPVGLGSSPPSRRATGKYNVKAESGRVALSAPRTLTTTEAEATVVDLAGEDGDEEMEDD